MKENDDIWLKQWKDCLEDFEEEVPVGGWEKLQADLQAHDPLVQQETPSDEPLVIEMTPAHDEEDKAKPAARVIPFQRWRIVAAAAVVVLIAGAGIWFLASDKVPQVPTIESPIAQVSQTEIPDPMQPMSAAETATEESITTDDETPAPVKQEEVKQETVTQQNEPIAGKQEVVKQQSPAAEKQEAAQQTKTQTSSMIAQAKVAEEKVEEVVAEAPKAEETQRKGTPIQVRKPSQTQTQRSATPVVAGKSSITEVSTIDRREMRKTTDERLLNVTHLRSEATTRSVSEITDMDRVYNSYTAHYDELYNKSEHLFDNGTGDYSTVDNALFLAGLVKKMQRQRSAADEQLFREIALRFIELQQPNGLWKDSLLDPTSHSVDTDTDSYICYALAWGLNNGLLSRKQYLDAVRHAWRSIGNCNSEPCLMAAEQVKKLQ